MVNWSNHWTLACHGTFWQIFGWNFFKVYHTRQNGPSLYYNPYILIPTENNESKIFKMTILDYYNSKFHHNHP
jgi:hypothetical protein